MKVHTVTSEAVGAIARGKSLIVVVTRSTSTQFFSSTNVDVEEACIDDMEKYSLRLS